MKNITHTRNWMTYKYYNSKAQTKNWMSEQNIFILKLNLEVLLYIAQVIRDTETIDYWDFCVLIVALILQISVFFKLMFGCFSQVMTVLLHSHSFTFRNQSSWKHQKILPFMTAIVP